MKFHFAITGHGKASTEVEFVEWLQDMLAEYNNNKSGSPLDSYHVLVREDDIEE